MDSISLTMTITPEGRHEWRDSHTGELLSDGEPTATAINVRLPTTLHSELSLIATLTSRTMADICRTLLINYLRPGTLPPLERETVESLLRRRAEALRRKANPPPPPSTNPVE